MVNTDRVVPIQSTDYLSMIGTILVLADKTPTVLASSTVDGQFSVTGTGDVGNVLANQPVKTLDFASGVTAGVVYFVPAYGFAGITVAGAAVTPTGSVAENDGVTLYTATLASGAVTIAAVTPSLA